MDVIRSKRADLLDALGRLAERLADRRFHQGATLMRSVETMHEADGRRRAKESKGVMMLDQSTHLRRSAEAAFAAAKQARSKT